MVAAAVGPWALAVLRALPAPGDGGVPTSALARTALAGVIVLALLRVGWRPWPRLLAWPVAVGIAWGFQAVATAMAHLGAYARPGMGEGEGLRELVDATVDVLLLSSRGTVENPAPALLAVVTALVVAAVSTSVGRGRSAAST
ncbi:MAG: hypothetical protein ACRCXL_11425 [Dermatophilaceae bacterium]